jgi:hypothetical protein
MPIITAKFMKATEIFWIFCYTISLSCKLIALSPLGLVNRQKQNKKQTNSMV